MAHHKQQVLSLTPGEALAFLVREAQALPRDRRVAIGITGGPGVGKSTLATQLVAALNALEPVAAYVPMDGFHMLHAKLEQLGTVADKGAPHTFEGEAFTSFISTLKSASGPVSGPGYSREIEDVVQDAFIIAADVRLLIVEGNYLLLPDPPWHGVKPLLGLEAYFVDDRTVRDRKVERNHLTLLAATDEGFKNLTALSSKGFLEGLHRGKPGVDLELLAQHADGIICLTGCLAARTSQRIVEGKPQQARAQRCLRSFLHLHVQRGADPQAAGIDAVRAVLRLFAIAVD